LLKIKGTAYLIVEATLVLSFHHLDLIYLVPPSQNVKGLRTTLFQLERWLCTNNCKFCMDLLWRHDFQHQYLPCQRIQSIHHQPPNPSNVVSHRCIELCSHLIFLFFLDFSVADNALYFLTSTAFTSFNRWFSFSISSQLRINNTRSFVSILRIRWTMLIQNQTGWIDIF
jgi:hypothetical protein